MRMAAYGLAVQRVAEASLIRGPLPVSAVTLYVAHDCHLCERARAELEPLRAELGFELDEVDITGVPELERRYREWIPVVEIDGERASPSTAIERSATTLRHKLGSLRRACDEPNACPGVRAECLVRCCKVPIDGCRRSRTASASASPRGSRATSRC